MIIEPLILRADHILSPASMLNMPLFGIIKRDWKEKENKMSSPGLSQARSPHEEPRDEAAQPGDGEGDGDGGELRHGPAPSSPPLENVKISTQPKHF